MRKKFVIKCWIIDGEQLIQTDFGKVMKYISVSDEKEKYRAVANEEPYKEIKAETARLLNECVGLNLQIEEEEENVKVCKAVQDIKEEGITIGEARGREAGKCEAEERFAKLTDCLEKEHRVAEIIKAAKDKEYREQLYREYGIE